MARAVKVKAHRRKGGVKVKAHKRTVLSKAKEVTSRSRAELARAIRKGGSPQLIKKLKQTLKNASKESGYHKAMTGFRRRVVKPRVKAAAYGKKRGYKTMSGYFDRGRRYGGGKR